jgi:cytochrome P450
MFLAMVLHPEIMQKAQQELDDVLGNRLPDFSDRSSLPYIDAILREVLRWQPVTPGGFPHMLSADDVYNGMFMPKGSVVVGNTW